MQADRENQYDFENRNNPWAIASDSSSDSDQYCNFQDKNEHWAELSQQRKKMDLSSESDISYNFEKENNSRENVWLSVDNFDLSPDTPDSHKRWNFRIGKDPWTDLARPDSDGPCSYSENGRDPWSEFDQKNKKMELFSEGDQCSNFDIENHSWNNTTFDTSDNDRSDSDSEEEDEFISKIRRIRIKPAEEALPSTSRSTEELLKAVGEMKLNIATNYSGWKETRKIIQQ